VSARRAVWIAWGSVAVYVTLTAVGLALQLGAPKQDLPGDEESLALDVAFGLVLLVFTLVGALIASRRPRHPVGWLLLATGLISALSDFAAGYARQALLTDPDSLPVGEWFAWLSSWLESSIMGLVILLLLVFPDGRLVSRRWRPFVWLTVVTIALILADAMLTPGRLYGFERVENPLGIGSAGFLREVDSTALGLLLFPVAVVGLFVKRRRATAEQRMQLKWFLFAASLLVFVPALAAISEVAIPQGANTANLVGGFLFAVAFGILAVSVGIAVLKHRLYDIDVVINRTLVYGALTATLALAYLGSVLLLGLALRPLTASSNLAIAGSTLAVAALFRPARARIQELVDRRFYRRKYDAAQTLETFSARLRDEIELDALSEELRRVVGDTMQPAHVSLWLRAPEGPR